MRFENAEKYWGVIAAGLSTVVTLILALMDRTSSAGIAAGFTVALVLLHNLPRLAKFKGWGVEAELREIKEEVAKAEEVLHRIDSTTKMIGVATLNWILHVGRLSSPSWEERARIIREIRSLYEHKPTPSSISSLEAQIFGLIGWRLLDTTRRVIAARVRLRGIEAPDLFVEHHFRDIVTLADLDRDLERLVADSRLNGDDLIQARALADKMRRAFQQHLDLMPSELDETELNNNELYEETFGEAHDGTIW